MKKILLLACISILGLTEFAQSQSACSRAECGENPNPNRICKEGGGSMSCKRLPSPLPTQQWGSCGWVCPEDPPPPTIGQKQEKCPKGEILKNGKCEPDCMETLTVPDIIGWWSTNNKNPKPTPAEPSAAPSMRGFINNQFACFLKLINSASPVLAQYADQYKACTKESSLALCYDAILRQNPGLELKINKECQKLTFNRTLNTNASVIDTIWRFVTHKIY